MLKTPILFIIFNRPDTTERVFAEISKQKPKYLYVAADGPRSEEEKAICEQARKVIDKVDWDCEIKTLFRERNLGCKAAVSSAIDWFFDNVEEGIILEDDCLPSQAFFPYCEELLEKYRHDTRIMHISGETPTNSEFSDGSYFFATTAHVWGWASWRRAWQLYDVEMKSYSKFKELDKIQDIFSKKEEKKYWLRVFDRVTAGEINTWDYQWMYALYVNNGLSIIPNKNLISNIGFGNQATHTSENSCFANRKITQNFEVIHPSFILPDKAATNFILKERFGIQPKTPLFIIQREFHRTFKKLAVRK